MFPFSKVEFLKGETFVLNEETSQDESALPFRELDSKELEGFFPKVWVLVTAVDPGVEEKLDVIESALSDSWIQELLELRGSDRQLLNLGRGGFGVLPVFRNLKD